MAYEDALLPISEANVQNLLSVLKQNLHDSTVVYNWICVQIEWLKKIPGIAVHILCPEGKWQDGTVVAFTDGLALEGKKYGVVYAREGRGAQLAAALRATRAVPWHDMLHFSGVLERHVDMLRSAATAAGVKLPTQQPPLFHLIHFPGSLASLESQMETRKQAEAGVRVSRLEPRHLDEVWRLRPLFPECYKPVIGACLEHNLSAGVFVTRPDGTEVLVSMVMQAEYGGLGMGQTHADYLHRGYSALAGAHIMRAMLEREINVHAWTATTNDLVVNFMKGNGMQFVDKVKRVVISPDAVQLRGHL